MGCESDGLERGGVTDPFASIRKRDTGVSTSFSASARTTEADRKLIERVGRAICIVDGRHWNNLRETQRLTYRRRAEAALVEATKVPCPRCAAGHGGVGLVNLEATWRRCRTCGGAGAL